MPLEYTNMGVTRGRLPQRAGLPSLNGGGTAAAVPQAECNLTLYSHGNHKND